MFGFGKKKLYEEEAVASFAKALIDDVNESFPWFLHQWKTSPCASEFPPFPRNSIDVMYVAVLALEIVSLPYLFPIDQAKRIKRMSVDCFAEQTGKPAAEILAEVDAYEQLFNEEAKTNPANPLKGVCQRLYEKIWPAGSMGPVHSETANPSFMFSTIMGNFLMRMSGCWKGLRHYYKIVPRKA